MIRNAVLSSLYPIHHEIFYILSRSGINEINNFILLIDEIQQITFTPLMVEPNDFLNSPDLKIMYENEQ